MIVADTCRVLVRPKLESSGWDGGQHFYSEQSAFTDGRIIVSARKPRRFIRKFSDFLLRCARDITLAVVEAKSNIRSGEDGLEQANDGTAIMGLRFAYAANIIEYDLFTAREKDGEKFPGPNELWLRYRQGQALSETIADTPLVSDFRNLRKIPRYYQRIAINRAIESILKAHRCQSMALANFERRFHFPVQRLFKWDLYPCQ